MSTTITVPDNYGYVILSSLVLPWIASELMSGKVMGARKTYDVQYPNLYATPGYHKEAEAFNRLQRGHQNMFEYLTHFTVMSLIGGLKHPNTCIVGGVFFSVGSILYQFGYGNMTQDVKMARHTMGGPIRFVGVFGSLGCCISIAASMCGWI